MRLKAVQISSSSQLIQRLNATYIQVPQVVKKTLPSQVVIFLDIKNMSNSDSRQEIFSVIQSSFPELLPLTHLLYENAGTVHKIGFITDVVLCSSYLVIK